MVIKEEMQFILEDIGSVVKEEGKVTQNTLVVGWIIIHRSCLCISKFVLLVYV